MACRLPCDLRITCGLGDVICIQYNGLVIGGQIVSLAHNALDDTRKN